MTESDISNESQLLNGLESSDYSSSFSGIGENMNISLHQSYLNTSFNTILNTSNMNTFTLPCPTDINFNSSYTNVTITDIFAPNKSIVYEDDGIQAEEVYTYQYAASFTIPGTGYLNNVSLQLLNVGDATSSDLRLRIYKSKWNTGGYSEPDSVYSTLVSGVAIDGYDDWYKFSGFKQLLNVSDTQNNTFFVGLKDFNDATYWYFDYDVDPGSVDDSNDLDCFYESGLNTWVLYNPLLRGSDFNMKCDFFPLNNTPNPEDIGLKINNKYANGYINVNGSGYWESYKVNSSASGELQYKVSADWWDVECNISQVQINYTKTNLEATSEFNIAGSGQTVNWNVTRNGGLNYFGSRFENYQINFTIPNGWDKNTIKVFNGPTPKTSDSINHSLGNGYREVNILNAGNGTFWYLEADSTNLLSSIDSLNTFDFTDLAHFDATFSTDISDGIINLSAYSPVAINNELNYSIRIESFTAGSTISLTDWDISDNVTQYGDFRVQVSWYNSTSAGFKEKSVQILGVTELIPTLPKFKFNASESFDIEVYFNDTGLIQGIDSATISYQIESGPIRTDKINPLGNGYYNITIDCNDTDFNGYGVKSIEINASKAYYNQKSELVKITILGETDLVPSIPKLIFDSTETFDVSLFFNDTVKPLGIDSATREVYINSTPYTPIANIDYGDGNYDITINCSDDLFDAQGYGYFNLSLRVEKDFYYNQSVDYIIYITGVTTLTHTIIFPDPGVGYYNSDQIFNITAYFEDVGRSEGIDGGQLTVYVKNSTITYQEYTTVSWVDIGGGNYNITIDCSDAPPFYPYSKYDIKINITKSNYYNAEDFLQEIVVGNTTLTILEPTMPISYVEDETFDIMIEYEDHTRSSGITGADITYTIDGTTYRTDNISPGVAGIYNITIDVSDTDFGTNYGNVDIIIRANKSYYVNLTTTFTFERQITTKIEPFNNPPLIEVIRGLNATYTFNYTDKNDNPIDKYNTFQITSPLYGFQWYPWNNGSGYYTIELNTTNVLVTGTPYILNFSIYAFGNQSQEISLSILVTIIETRIEVESWNQNADFARSTNIELIINFYFNDTTNNLPIENLTASNIIVRNSITGIIWSPGFELFNRTGAGNYTLNIKTIGAPSGSYNLELSVSKFPNYDVSYQYFQFYLRGNYTYFNLLTISDPGGALTSINPGHHYRIFEGSITNLVYNILDLEYNNNTVLSAASSYLVGYRNLDTGTTGTLQSGIQFVYPNHVGFINTSVSELVPGTYLINISTVISNYETTIFEFNLTIIEKYNVNLDVIDSPIEVTAGTVFNITILAEYWDGTTWLPLVGETIIVTPYFDGMAGDPISPIYSNSSGYYIFQIPTRTDATNITLMVEIPITYKHLADTLEILNIILKSPPSGLTFEDLLPYIIIIGSAVVAVGGSVAVYRGIIVPKKRRKTRILTEVKTIFDDAINLEHILVLYKGTGTCIYFKSFGSEQIDPELISGFISAISSFGKDLVSQEELNEISYGDKMLLLSDGEYIRVALVLSKKASLILRRNLMEFIHTFERDYTSNLPNWRGQLNIFRDAGTIVDEILSTSIILPHEITYEHSSVKTLKKTQSKEVIKIANNLMKDSERNFFFIATLLKEATEKTGRDTAEIFVGIKELRDTKILMPIEISTIEEKPISQQEMNLINQKISTLVNLTPEERQKLVNDLAQVGPGEREAYFASLAEQHEIVSAPIESTAGTTLIKTKKEAKKELNNLKKIAMAEKKKKDYENSLKILQNAAKIALNWELGKESLAIDDIMRQTKIEDLYSKMKILEKEAKFAVKKGNYNEAAQKYKMSSKIASEIFKLGVTYMTKEVKRLTNKANEYEKLA